VRLTLRSAATGAIYYTTITITMIVLWVLGTTSASGSIIKI